MTEHYKIFPSENREEWLASRQMFLTATDIARLWSGGPSEWERVREEKNGVQRNLDNKYLRFGQKMEPVIAAWVAGRMNELTAEKEGLMHKSFPALRTDSTLEPNDQLLISRRNSRIAATPDMLGEDVIGEIKTSKHERIDMKPGAKLRGIGLRYWVQVQVQLYVSGADACVFVWAEHDDDWETGPRIVDTGVQIIRPDLDAFKRIEEIVHDFDNPPKGSDADNLMRELGSLERKKKVIEAQIADIREDLKQMIPLGESLVGPAGKASYYEPSQSSRFDSKAFKRDHPELAEKYTTITAGKPVFRFTPAK